MNMQKVLLMLVVMMVSGCSANNAKNIVDADATGTYRTVSDAKYSATSSTEQFIGDWNIVANNHTGKMEIRQSGGVLTGRVWFDKYNRWENLSKVKIHENTLQFHRAGQNYTGNYSAGRIVGTFVNYTRRNYDWTAVKSAQGNQDIPCCDLTGDFAYSGKGLVEIKQSGSNVHMYLTWVPDGRGPHYEVKGTLTGNTIRGKWYSHYKKQGWFDFVGIVSPSGKMIDFSQTQDPTKSNLNNIVLIDSSLQGSAGISFINAASVDLYMKKQEVQLSRELHGTGIDVVRQNKHIILKLPNNITFDTDSDVLKPKFAPVLKSITSVLKEYHSTLVTTIGHTDNVGAIEHNQTLSENRAKYLSDYLAANGINQNRLTFIGKGQFYPVASNATSNGRASNRRGEIMLEALHN